MAFARSLSFLPPSLTSRGRIVGLGRLPPSIRRASSTSPSLLVPISSLLLAGAVGAALATGLCAFAYMPPIALESTIAPQLPLGVARAQRYGSPTAYVAAVDELRVLFPGEDSHTIDPDDLLTHGGSSWAHLASQPPSIVVYPKTTEDVQLVMAISQQNRVPVVPYGAGTSLEGQFNAPFGGICIDLARHMNKIITIHAEDGDAVVQPVELLDNLQIEAINKMGSLPSPLAVRDTIFFKFQGSPVVIEESARVVEEIIRRHGGDALQLAKTEKESDQLWGARRGALFSSLAASGYPNPTIYGNDICVPVSALPAFVAHCKKTLQAAGVYAPVVGHVGDGNVHLNVVLKDRSELPKMDALMKSFIWKAIEMDGTCTGEHGVGMNKKVYLTKELGTGTISLLRTIKNAVDPLGLLNPGKLYPDELPPQSPFPDPSHRLEMSYPPPSGCSC